MQFLKISCQTNFGLFSLCFVSQYSVTYIFNHSISLTLLLRKNYFSQLLSLSLLYHIAYQKYGMLKSNRYPLSFFFSFPIWDFLSKNFCLSYTLSQLSVKLKTLLLLGTMQLPQSNILLYMWMWDISCIPGHPLTMSLSSAVLTRLSASYLSIGYDIMQVICFMINYSSGIIPYHVPCSCQQAVYKCTIHFSLPQWSWISYQSF